MAKKLTKKIEQFSIIYLTHCARSVKIVLTIRNNPCKNMGDILEKGDNIMANDEWDIFNKEFNKEIQRSIEISRRTMDLCIQPYIKELAIYKRALELACEKYINVDGISYVLRDDEDYFDKSDEQVQKETVDYFVDQAKKELEE